MITTDGMYHAQAITRETARHKFGGDPMAEYLYGNAAWADDESGSVEWDVWFARFGKRIIVEDDRGFVGVHKFESEAKAIDTFELWNNEYCEWLED